MTAIETAETGLEAAVEAFSEFEAFFAASYPDVVRSLTLVTGDRDRAEELAQDGFTQALRRWRRVSAMDRPATWVYVVALNAERKRWRRDERRSARTERAPLSAVADASAAIDARMAVADSLALLPPRQRTAVVLRYLAGLSLRETAEAMGCAEGTVKSTLHAALAAMRIELNDEFDSETSNDGRENRR